MDALKEAFRGAVAVEVRVSQVESGGRADVLVGVLCEDKATDIDNSGYRRQCWRLQRFHFKCLRVGRKLLEVFKAEPCRKEKKRSTAFLRLLFIDVAAKHFLRHPPL
jgi:hypothetical protein